MLTFCIVRLSQYFFAFSSDPDTHDVYIGGTSRCGSGPLCTHNKSPLV